MTIMFDTETMAELCIQQGLVEQAISIYRRMATTVDQVHLRQRYRERLVELEQAPGPAPLETPGLRVVAVAGEVCVEWRLPPSTVDPALQLLLLRRTPNGIEAETRTLPLASLQGRTTMPVTELHSVRAAAGRLAGGVFVPLIRLAAPPLPL